MRTRLAVSGSILLLALSVGAAPAAPRVATSRSPCSTCRTTRPASSTRTSTRRSPSTGRRRPGRTSPSSSRTAAPASRPARSSTASRPTSSRWRWPTTSTPIADKAGLLPANWQTRLPNNSSPYTSTIVFLVRKGNPKEIKDWGDLAKPGVSVDHAQPEDLGRRALELPGRAGARRCASPAATRRRAQDFVTRLYKNVPVLDTGARGSTTTFVERGIGDVLIAWENEALLAVKELGPDKFEIVVPSLSILAEPPVAVVDKVVEQARHQGGGAGLPRVPVHATRARRSRRSTSTGRAIRPSRPSTQAQFPKLSLFTIDEVFGGWQKAQETSLRRRGRVRSDLPARALSPGWQSTPTKG